MASTSLSKIPIGTVLGEKYRVTREIGRGGMAAVYEAENVHIGKRVAVKVLAPELTGSTIVVERFLREARAAASISSPHICDVYDSGKLDDGRPFLVLELLEGESLYEYMTQVRQIDVHTTVRIVTQVARGLMKAHAAGVVHRDLKPENIFLTKDADGGLLAKILDFGLAKFYAPVSGDAAQARLTREGAVFGTPAYMSPEQVKGQGQVDQRADLWALGCITYECVTGRTVWSTDQGVAMTFAQIASSPLPNALDYRPDLPLVFQAWFAKALARSIDDRFQNAKELADALTAAISDATPHVLSIQSLTDGPFRSTAYSPPMSGAMAAAAPTSSANPGMPPSSAQPFVAPPLPGSDSAGAGVPNSRTSGGNAIAATVERAAGHRDPAHHSGRATFTLLGVAAITAGGYAAWMLFLRPQALPLTTISSPSASADASTPNQIHAEPPPTTSPKGPKWAAAVGSAQGQVAASDLPGAIRTLKDADAPNGSTPRVILAMLEPAQSAAATAKGSCRLTGVARPRPLVLSSAAGRPAIAYTPRGALVVWTDGHDLASGEHAYSILLDSAMRSGGEPHDVTPEAGLVSNPQLVVVGDRIAIFYSDSKGAETGIHARWLDAEGKVAGPARKLLARKPPSTPPSVDRAPDGTFWVAWEDERRPDASDLSMRHLGKELEPIGAEVRASDYAPKSKSRVRYPSLGIAGGFLTVVYRFEREPLHLVSAQRIGLSDPQLERGLEPWAEKSPPKDRQLGEPSLLNPERDRAEIPRIDCTPEGCYVVWQTEDGSAFAAYMESIHGQILWRKRFDRRAAHPTVAIAPSGAAEIAWFSRGRLNLAPIARDGVGQSTPLTRVAGDPPPSLSLAPGGAPGEWYATWLEPETGHLEVYSARALCK